ncbi:hypothetical protein [Paenibacillus oleatilyticus]|uniref:Uncharacterized protein n=1 Tax=Paenibacillus oleatilyticus TaxID=2594886 RepID=A0ABV4V137_9BACL
MMKKPAFLVSMCLSMGLLYGALPVSAEPAPAVPLQAGHDISPMVDTGWVKTWGAEARLYTDREKDYSPADSYVEVTAEKKGWETNYYEIYLYRVRPTGLEFVDYKTGYMSVGTKEKFYIDDFLSKGSSGEFKVEMKLYKERKDRDQYLGDWGTTTFKINH